MIPQSCQIHYIVESFTARLGTLSIYLKVMTLSLKLHETIAMRLHL